MAFKIVLAPSAQKEFDKLSPEVRRKVRSVVEDLKASPFIGKKPKAEYAGNWTVRVWPYRVMYKIFQDSRVVYVVRIRHRKDAYR